MQPYLNKDHHLYMDNYYNSVDLSNNLFIYKFYINKKPIQQAHSEAIEKKSQVNNNKNFKIKNWTTYFC